MSDSLAAEYARSLAASEGDDFQAEVCARLRSVILGFQDVPARQQGDAGLDGFSHNGEHGYCCYGPRHDSFKTNTSRATGIVKKFCTDLRRLFELATRGKNLIHKENQGLSTVLPKGARIKHIKLITNWFESKDIAGRILTEVAKYKAASLCRYVDYSVTVVVVGPEQLAADYAVDELTIARARQRILVEKVQHKAETVAISDSKDFEWKMELLKDIRPDQPAAVMNLAEGLRNDWRSALAFELELGDSAPSLHQSLEETRRQIMTRVSALMLSSDEPWKQLPNATAIATELLEVDFGRLFRPLLPTIASGEVARLVGECTIGWKKSTAKHGGS